MQPYLTVIMTATIAIMLYLILAAAMRLPPFPKNYVPQPPPSSQFCSDLTLPCPNDPQTLCCPGGTTRTGNKCCVTTRRCIAKRGDKCAPGMVAVGNKCCEQG